MDSPKDPADRRGESTEYGGIRRTTRLHDGIGRRTCDSVRVWPVRMELSASGSPLDLMQLGQRGDDPTNRHVPQISQLSWTDGVATRHSIHVGYDGHP